MAEERPKPTLNGTYVTMAVSNDAALEPRMLRVDATTGRLLVDTSISGIATAVTDGEAVDAADTGTLALGTDGTNYQVLSVDSSGNLQIDILTIAAGDNNIGNVDVASIAAGTNNIGDVDIASIAAGTNNIGDVDIASIAAGDNNIGNVDIVSMPAVDTELPTAAALSDGDVDSTPTTVKVGSIPLLRNSAGNLDRARSAANATNSTGTGIQAVGLTAQFDDASPTSITENQFGNVRMSANRNLFTTLRDAAGNERGLNVDANGEVGISAVRNALPAGTNNIGQVSVAPQTANGLSVFNATSSDGATALTSTAQAIKASAGQVYGWYIYNPNSSAQFVQFYNTAAGSVTVGTTNPLFMLTIPATSAANVEFTNGITFSNAGFSCAATSTAGGSGAPSTALDAVIFYK